MCQLIGVMILSMNKKSFVVIFVNLFTELVSLLEHSTSSIIQNLHLDSHAVNSILNMLITFRDIINDSVMMLGRTYNKVHLNFSQLA